MIEQTAVCCTLTAQEQCTRRSWVRAKVVSHIVIATPVTNGLLLEFEPASRVRELIRDFVILEQDCCRFLTFTLSQPSDELSLPIQGPPESANVIEMFLQTIRQTVS